MEKPGTARHRIVLWLVGAAWIAAVAFGLTMTWTYETAAGANALAPSAWPAATDIPAPGARAALVVLVHPQCSCSRATISELARVMAVVDGRVDAYVLVLSPRGVAPEWVESELWNTAAAIPGVRVRRDADGRDAAHFGAVTSGQALLYGRHGQLLYNGGMTASRGHEGDNAGSDSLAALILDQPVQRSTAPVFGCALFASAPAEAPEPAK
jgi:hypothetical protein